MTYKKIISYFFSLFLMLWGAQFFIVLEVGASSLNKQEEVFISNYTHHAGACTQHLNSKTLSIALTPEQKANEKDNDKSLRRQSRAFMSLTELLEDKSSVCVAIFFPRRPENGKYFYISANHRLGNVRFRLKLIRYFLSLELKEPGKEIDDDSNAKLVKIIETLSSHSIHKKKRIKRRLKRLYDDLPSEAKDAIQDDCSICYTDCSDHLDPWRYASHAEMNLIQYLKDQEVKLNGYLGISKLCCQSCTTALYAIHKTNSSTGFRFETGGSHGGGFPGVRLPNFIFSNDILQHFLGEELYADIAKYCKEQNSDFNGFIRKFIDKANRSSEGYKLKAEGKNKIYNEVSEVTEEQSQESIEASFTHYPSQEPKSIPEQGTSSLKGAWTSGAPTIQPDKLIPAKVSKLQTHSRLAATSTSRSSSHAAIRVGTMRDDLPKRLAVPSRKQRHKSKHKD